MTAAAAVPTSFAERASLLLKCPSEGTLHQQQTLVQGSSSQQRPLLGKQGNRANFSAEHTPRQWQRARTKRSKAKLPHLLVVVQPVHGVVQCLLDLLLVLSPDGGAHLQRRKEDSWCYLARAQEQQGDDLASCCQVGNSSWRCRSSAFAHSTDMPGTMRDVQCTM